MVARRKRFQFQLLRFRFCYERIDLSTTGYIQPSSAMAPIGRLKLLAAAAAAFLPAANVAQTEATGTGPTNFVILLADGVCQSQHSLSVAVVLLVLLRSPLCCEVAH